MFDLQTLIFSSIAAATISALFFTIVWHLNRKEPGVLSWLIALWMQSTGITLLSFRQDLGSFWSIIVANTLLVYSFLFVLTGTRRFFNQKKYNAKIAFLYLLFFLPLYLYFTYVSPNIAVRVAIVYISFIVFLSACITTIIRTPEARTTAGYIFCFICTLIITLSVIRLGSGIFLTHNASLFNLNISNFVGSLTGFIIPYGFTLGFFLLCNERKINEVKQLEIKALEEAELKNQLLATLSHELRTPLNGMIGKAQIIKDSHKELSSDLNSIIQSGKSLASLTNQILEYAAIEGRKSIQINNRSINFSLFINHILEMISPLATNKGIDLNLDMCPSVPSFLVFDENKLQQVILNLVNNAIKYTDQGHCTILVKFKHNHPKGDQLFIKVKDTGIGIPKQDQNKIFKPFQRAKNSYLQEGSGIGLALCKKLLSAMNSSLEFSSTLNQGSEFYFNLTVNTDESSNSLATFSDYDTYQANKSLNILIVEDIPLNIEIISTMLKKHKHSVISAATGKKAITLCHEVNFDLVLLDMQLPDMHGIQILEQIRKVHPTIPIWAMTAALTPKDRELYQQSSLSGVIEKPILTEDLNSLLGRTEASHLNTLQNSNSSFDPKPLQFLIENLAEEDLKRAINRFPADFWKAISLLDSQDLQSKQKSIHRLVSLTGQFGLISTSNELKNAHITDKTLPQNDLEKIFDSLEQGLALLHQYLNSQHA